MDERPEWWRTFFEGPVVDFWLRASSGEATAAEADFVVEALGVRPGARLLDVPCGGGRHALRLAAKGYEMTGVDISPGFLAEARSRGESARLSIRWEEREMRDLPWPGAFDGAYCLGNSFGYLDDEGHAAFLRSVADAIRPGAGFVLETGYLVETVLPTLQERGWYPDGDGYTLSARRYDPETGRLHVAYTFIHDGRSETRATSARLHSVREVVGMLRAAGFAEVETYGSIGREPFRMGSARLVAVARKN